MVKISEAELKKRMQKLRNYENILYPRLKERSDKVREENQSLKEENSRIPDMEKQIEKLKLRIEELETMKFGKKRTSRNKVAISLPDTKEKKKKKRHKESYRRKKPEEEEITDRLRMEIEKCHECGEKLINKEEHTHYREDIKKVEDLIESARKIVEVIIESGKCPQCGVRRYGMEIPKQEVILGENIRQMVVYLTVIQGQSYSEILKGLRDQYGIELSSGSIANILEGESVLLTPYYNNIVESLNEEGKIYGCHYDETSWKTGSKGEEVSEGNYCWTKVGVKSEKRLIWFGCSRGKGVAEELRGQKKGSKGVSDDYGAYKYTFEYHQICWAHPHRKLRDLAESSKIEGKTKKVCQEAFKQFRKVYKEARRLRESLLSGMDGEEKEKKYEEVKKGFIKLFEEKKEDPEKLKAIRKSLEVRMERYFSFIDHPDLPLDNNKAERSLRKVVLKRKKSFGSQSQKGANVLSILYSVIFSMTEENPKENFFKLYNTAANFDSTENKD